MIIYDYWRLSAIIADYLRLLPIIYDQSRWRDMTMT